jgi:RNA polymerase sigma-70 factor (ECF subfamily)
MPNCRGGEPNGRCCGRCTAAVQTLLSASSWQCAPALEELCGECWSAVCGSLRRLGASPDEAEDLTQTFFLQLVSRRSIEGARLSSGCFRPYLLAAARNLLFKHRARERAQKRGAGLSFVTFEEGRSGNRESLTTPSAGAPDAALDRDAFERAWVRAVADVREEAEREDCRRVEALLPHLDGLGRGAESARLAAELGMTPGAVRVALHRLRLKLRARLAAAGYGQA